jgi:hypothetical protein
MPLRDSQVSRQAPKAPCLLALVLGVGSLVVIRLLTE